MEFTLHTCAVVMVILILGHVQGTSDLKQLSRNVRHRFIGEVLVSIARKQQLTKNIDLNNITVDADSLTTVLFTHLRLLNTDVEASSIVGDYEIVSNDVQLSFPRSGHLNVSFHELLKEIGWESAVTRVHHPAVEVQKNYTLNVDLLVDFFLTIVRETLHKTGHSSIKIPDVDESFTTDIIFFPVNGRFRAENGWLGNLSTIYRTSDTIATVVDNTLTVVGGFGLQMLEFGFNQYEANFGVIQASGTITGVIPHNSITAQISLTHVNGVCNATLDNLKVSEASGIKVYLTGWDGLGWLLSFITNCASGSYRDKIFSAVEAHLSANIEKQLRHFHCEQYFQQVLSQLL
ncbi:hypothetical protein B7P43_G04577 [Cryptotermes secundus]|uniref:Lipid-binding serum glycoprotein N-terminal domain-containing protein n=2 Tax=Cryptotermes secundus TaxID=105785 RepID=A0A2J7PID2_9NEOP|nr:uncharacterized protein LOC111873785 isoform X2 [Cryptotermes secundus]XP_033611101.1 uncharacterized protein LOC111873785 isoform X2 [Cryptotermes secundus]PNF16073.1 hypothetical protein B7P43_G04577 [Cryptotermes secundus]PNF16074.1 hypothetical protein B7P43_G04577 [Cryptotermes secundus]PNF16075.1 hypothetical protein B7P43_G04577 [Cryptotermes secundus]